MRPALQTTLEQPPGKTNPKTESRQRPMNVILYTRRGCHLCDEAYQTLLQHGLQPTLIDIDNQNGDDSDLKQKYDCCVPVVEIDGKIRFRGKVEPILLSRLLRA